MRKVYNTFAGLLLIVLASGGCSSQQLTGANKDEPVHKKPDNYNFKFVAFDTGIENPDNDRRGYYKIYIDKIDEGRTTTGLESQKKSFTATLTPNKHLMVVEKWVLDESQGRYVKLNNIHQPKPNYAYFTIPKDRIVMVILRTNQQGRAEYSIGYELEE